MLREDQIRRYARHVLLPDVGGVGQRRLLAATVEVDLSDPAGAPAAIVAATYLAAAGVGALILSGADRPATPADVAGGVALGATDLGRPLRPALAARLAALNPDVALDPAGPASHRCAVSDTAPELPEAAPVSVPGTERGWDLAALALVAGGVAASRTIHAIARGAP